MLACDVKTATLEIVDPQVPADQRVLADYQKVPTSICMRSGATPPGGITTEVVLGGANPANLDVKGKLVLGQRGSKVALAKAGAVGMILDFTENFRLADERGWVTFGGKGWSFTRGSSPLVLFDYASGIGALAQAAGPRTCEGARLWRQPVLRRCLSLGDWSAPRNGWAGWRRGPLAWPSVRAGRAR